MPYAILRAKKLKSTASIAKSLRHTFREVPVPNADPSLTPRNEMVGPRTTEEALAKIKARWPAKRRKDAVLAIEYLVTASPEAFKRHGGTLNEVSYFNDALAWLRARHGTENVLVAGVHRDETSPHMVVYVVPEIEGRLNCRHFLGGSTCLSQMQDSFYQACGEKQGLDRGVKGSKAKHTTIKQFYTEAMKAAEIPPLSRTDLAAAAAGYETEAFKEATKAAQRAAKASVVAGMRSRAAASREKALERRETALDGRESAVDKRADAIVRVLDNQEAVAAEHRRALEAERRKTEEAQRKAQEEQERSARLRRELAEAEQARKLWLQRTRELEAELGKGNDYDGPRMR